MISADSTDSIPVITRAVDSIPRRSATETWGPIHELFTAMLQEHPQAAALSADLSDFGTLLPFVFMCRGLNSVTLKCGVLNLAVQIQYLGDSAEFLELPIVIPPEISAGGEVIVVLEITEAGLELFDYEALPTVCSSFSVQITSSAPPHDSNSLETNNFPIQEANKS